MDKASLRQKLTATPGKKGGRDCQIARACLKTIVGDDAGALHR
jgi:hypothetical protein